MDASAALAIDEPLQRRQSANLPIIIAGLDTDSGHILSRMKILDRVPLDNRFHDAEIALRVALDMLKNLS